MNRADYPPDWPAISRRVRDAAGNTCQQCGVANGAYGARDRHGAWHNEDDIHGMNSDCGFDLFGDFPDMIRIVLTVHHPDHDKANPEARMVVLCQRCHLNADRDHHMAKAAATRQRKALAKVLAKVLERQMAFEGLLPADQDRRVTRAGERTAGRGR